MQLSNYTKISFIILALVISCRPRDYDSNQGIGISKLSSVKIPLPEELKPHIGPQKIDSVSLSVTPDSCDSGISGSTIKRDAIPLEQADGKLANEKILKGCAYTIIVSLGKADAQQVKLEKTYLTNDLAGKQTKITKEESRSAKIKVTIELFPTEDAKKDLGFEGPSIIAPSKDETDLEIEMKFGARPQLLTGDYDWTKDIVLVDVPESAFTGNDYGSARYKDIMNHTPASQRDFQSGPSTHAHESLHGLQSVMRNATRENDGFLYYQNGKGAAVKEPKETLKDVRNHVGKSYQKIDSLNFNLYLITQTKDWNNILYIFDEWNGYIATARTAVEIKKAGKWDPSTNSNPVGGLVDLLYFCSASIISVKNNDPEYLKTNKQFKATFAMMMEESFKWLNEAEKDPLWASSSAWEKLKNIRTESDSVPVRNAVKELMGETWTKRVMGF